MILQFDVINQRIVRKDDNYIVANSQFYLQIDFNFTQDWYGFGKTITFVSGTKKFSIGLNAQDSCVVPYEVIKTPSFLFSIRGELDDVVITTNVITVPIKASGETNGIAPGEPPKEIFSGLQNGLKGQVLGKSSDDNYDYDFQNLKDLQYDDENTLGDVLEELVVDAVTDIKYEDGYLKKVENGETTNVVEMYDKEAIDNLLENLDQYIEKSDTPGLIKNDGTIDETQYASQDDLDNAKSDLQGDIDDLGTELRQSISNEENARIEAISQEANTRSSADTTLQTNINNEETARQNADSSLDTKINTEISNRESAISQEVSNRNAAIADEASARSQADTALGGRIDNEASARQNADNTLQGLINDEKGARQNVDTQLQTNINNEATARDTNDNALASAISDRLCIVKMDDVILNNWVDVGIPLEFENYSYVAVIRDTRIIGAQSVNVLFTIEQILSDNYCPVPLVDNVEGTIKIFGNDNMTITIPSVEIFKKIEYTIPVEEE